MYGGYVLFFASSQASTKKEPFTIQKDIEVLNKFAAKMVRTLQKNDCSKSVYILNKATTLWKKDPFAGADFEGKGHTKDLAAKTGLSYSGYIMLGDKMLSIINGMEYETGDAIEKSDYMVQSISPVMVVLGTGNGHKVILPLEEMGQGGL